MGSCVFVTELSTMRVQLYLCLLASAYSKSFFTTEDEDLEDSGRVATGSYWTYLGYESEEIKESQSYWETYRASLEGLWAKINSFDYNQLSQTVREEVREKFALVSGLTQKMRKSLGERGENVTNELKEKYFEAVQALKDLKSNLKLSRLFDKQELSESLNSLQATWEQLAIFEQIQRGYRNFTQGQSEYWGSSSNVTVSDFLTSVKSSIADTGLESYEKVENYLQSLHRRDSVCSQKILTCPDGVGKFSASTCCSSLWLSIGAPLGLGNECWTDLEQMLEQCTVFSCYGVAEGHFNISDGCSFIPDVLLNYESCVIHDLCYITPASTKPTFDRFMETNMNSIYCDNVNRYERALCKMRAKMASKALGWTDRYFVASGLMRENCEMSDGWLDRIWKFTKSSVSRYI